MDTIPEGAIPIDQFQAAPEEAAPPGAIPIDQFQSADDKSQFETAGQEALTAAEGAARGLTFGGSDWAAKGIHSLGQKIGINEDYLPSPENMAAREEANPGIAKIGEIGSLVGGTLLGVGAPAAIAKVAGAIAAPIVAESAMAKIGVTALKGAIEGGLFQSGDEVSKAALGQGDPEAPVAGALTNIGAGALLGGAIGGVFGTAGQTLAKIGETKTAQGLTTFLNDFGIQMSGVRPAAEDMANEAEQIRSSARLRPDADATMKAAIRLDLPVMNGMVSADKAVRMGEDALLHGPPTIPAVQRQNLYSDAYEGAIKKIDDVLPDVKIEKTDIGAQLKDSLSTKIQSEAEPFNELYGEIRKVAPDVPLKEASAPSIARNIRNIDGVKDAFKSPAASLARDIADEIESGNIKNVDQLRQYQTELSGRISPTASASEKRVLSIIKDKLDDWERRAIKSHADEFVSSIENRTDISPEEKSSIWGGQVSRIKDLQSKIDSADAQYAPFRQKLGELSGWLGKEKIGGAKDAISFISDRLEPEDLIQKLSSHRYSGLPGFMQKNFPEEYELIRQYEKSQLRQSAMRGQEFSHTQLFKKYEALPRDFKEAIFSPAERERLSDVRQYLGSFPENFNPSGTSHMTAYRAFFESLKGAALGNVRDAAIKKFVIGEDIVPMLEKATGRKLSEAEAAATLKVMSSGNLTGLGQVLRHTSTAAQGVRKMTRAVDALFKAGGQQFLDEEASEKDREKLKKFVEDGVQNQQIQNLAHSSSSPQEPPSPKFAKGGSVEGQISNGPQLDVANGMETHYPEQNILIQAAKTRINSYLNSQRPIKPSVLPFDHQPKNKDKEREYDHLLDMANKPLSILSKVSKGTITPKDVQHFQNLYPEIYSQLSKKLTERVVKAQESGEAPPYKTRQALGLFLGGHLDSSMTPQNVLAAQGTYQKNQQPQAQQQGKPPSSSSMKALGKSANRYKTSDQSVLSRQQAEH